MDAFDFKDSPKPKRPSLLPQGWIWLLGAVYFLCMAVGLTGYFAYTYTQPNNPYNPFPPGTQMAAVPTFTSAPIATTETANGTPTATQPLEFPTFTTAPGILTLTPTATSGQLPTQTEVTIQVPTATQPVSGNGPAFIIMQGNPLYLGHPNGCNGLYVAGNVTDLNGAPLKFMLIRAQGILGGQSLGLEDALSGGADQYSESGWEIILAPNPVSSTGTVWLQMFDPVTEDPVSDLIFFDTFNDCSKNLIMINFVQVRPFP